VNASIPPHYSAFRVVLVVTIVLAAIGGLWLLVDGQLLRIFGVRW
jgi:hypothetical protein